MLWRFEQGGKKDLWRIKRKELRKTNKGGKSEKWYYFAIRVEKIIDEDWREDVKL